MQCSIHISITPNFEINTKKALFIMLCFHIAWLLVLWITIFLNFLHSHFISTTYLYCMYEVRLYHQDLCKYFIILFWRVTGYHTTRCLWDARLARWRNTRGRTCMFFHVWPTKNFHLFLLLFQINSFFCHFIYPHSSLPPTPSLFLTPHPYLPLTFNFSLLRRKRERMRI